MRYQISGPWPVRGVCIPASAEIDCSKAEWAWLRDTTPPLSAVALDLDAACLMWTRYPKLRHKLVRKLGAYEAEWFERLKRDPAMLDFFWSGKPRPTPAVKPKPKPDFAAQLNAALATRKAITAGEITTETKQS